MLDATEVDVIGSETFAYGSCSPDTFPE